MDPRVVDELLVVFVLVAREPPLVDRDVVVVVRDVPPAVVDGLGIREEAVLEVTVDLAAPGDAREALVLPVAGRLVVVVVRLVTLVRLLVEWPDASDLPSSL